METNEENQPKKKCCNIKLLKHLALQLFDFGHSAGSLITETLEIFKTFQRISAPISFYNCFSHEVSPFFAWVNNIINIFADFFKTTPFDNFELYLLYSLIFPLAILMFISLMVNLKLGYAGLIACLLFFILGAGCGLCQDEVLVFLGIFMIIISFMIIIIGIFKVRCECCYCNCCNCYNFIFYMFKKPENENQENKYSHSSDSLQEQTDVMENNDNQNENSKSEMLVISRAFYPTSLVIYLLIIPIMVKREKYLKIASIIFIILYLIVFPLNYLIDKYFSNFMIQVTSKGLNFLVNCLSLLIIPSTNSYVELIAEEREGAVQCSVTYIVISLIFPIMLANCMIKYEHPDIFDKYKKDNKRCCKYAGIEVWDYLKQMVYAVVAAFDLAEICLITEFIWVLIIVIKKPYCNICDAILAVGHSIVAILSNFGICYVFYTNASSFNFKFTLILVAAAFVPTIIAMYVFFSVQFNFVEENEEETKKRNKILEKSLKKLTRVINIILPCCWFFFGINIYFISNGNHIRYG